MKVHFSKLSVKKLEILFEYLEIEWSEKVKNDFLEKLNSAIKVIEIKPESFPASSFDVKLRKCVVTKQTSLLYEIQDDFIFILNIIDNRQNPKKIKKELKKYFKIN